MNVHKIKGNLIKKHSNLPVDLSNIINKYSTVSASESRYIAINAYIKYIDKYGKIHIKTRDIKMVKEQIDKLSLKLQEDTYQRLTTPLKNYSDNDDLTIVCSVPTYSFPKDRHKIMQYIEDNKNQNIPLLLRAGTYLNTKYGSGVFYHIIPWGRLSKCEMRHRYKERVEPLKFNVKKLMFEQLTGLTYYKASFDSENDQDVKPQKFYL